MYGYLKRNEDNVWRDIGGEIVILDEEGEQVCLLNKTAAMIWTLADGTKTETDIAAQVCERFDVGVDQALADVQELGAQLLGAELLEYLDQPL